MNRKFFVIIRKQRILLTLLLIIIFIAGLLIVRGVSTREVQAIPSIGVTVVIDAGHGGIDPGCIGRISKKTESELNLIISKKLEKYLLSSGITVIQTRNDSSGLYGIYDKGYKKRDMLARKEIIESSKPNLVVSIHMNAFVQSRYRGAQTFYNETNEESRLLALAIQNNFANNLPNSDKGISVGDFFITKCTRFPTVLAECGYLSNPEDEELLITDAYQDKIAYNIYCGIIAFINQPTV